MTVMTPLCTVHACPYFVGTESVDFYNILRKTITVDSLAQLVDSSY